MNKEAFKIILFPHGEVTIEETGEKVYKYIVGGVILTDKKINWPVESVAMASGRADLTDILDHSPKYIPDFKLGQLGSAVTLLGHLQPENMTQWLSELSTKEPTAPQS